ncbi:2-dehydropantoate 2-reductase [Erysipelothrix rhusiopathiae]|uniref:ketopantoate reductase family protein n=1 Tax=Erysipelothrix rhusiopathiae TaxID=1648 RepID=UPI001EE05DD7|nr:2-dehydropantoate 2-reductase N-terminal domain-containing protein [Erysipelothrix rhusiopathiae]MCG4456106.1 2-dehydropantoate 2-reductase [Erysipelothrix rhusiopathiae]MDE8277396.1 2-dehydropantoate 2-reductase N-terminal domain-containing protein [Erysipelothrix rhusiopathiae]
MDILILGLGTIGTLYGSLFSRAGHNVEHFLREGKEHVDCVHVKLLDGRLNPKGKELSYDYKINPSTKKEYDFIFVSVSSGNLKEAMDCLRNVKIHGTVLLFTGVWTDHKRLDEIMGFYNYILGYPVGGGSMDEEGVLKAVVNEYVMIESKSHARIQNYNLMMSLFKSCDITFEIPHDMLEWMWVRMSVSAAIVSTVALYGNLSFPGPSVEYVMTNSKALAHCIRTIRETLLIARGRGINMNHFKQEILPYKFPAGISGWGMKVKFKTSRIARESMKRHNNIDDLMYICYEVYQEGKRQCVPMPHFTENMQAMLVKLDEQEHIDQSLYNHITNL